MNPQTDGTRRESVVIQAESPEPSTFALLRDIDRYSDKLWGTMVYFLALSIFLALIVIWGLFGLRPINEWWILVPILIYGGIVTVYYPIALFNAIRLVRPLRRWLASISDTIFEMTFHMLPVRGETPLDRIVNKISEVYTDIPELLAKRPGAIRKQVGLGRKKTVVWDLAIDLSYPRFPRFLSFLTSPLYILVKRNASETEVGVDRVRQIIEGTRRDLRWSLSTADILHMFIVSPNKFSVDTLAYVTKILEKVDFNITLVEETPKGYNLPMMAESDDLLAV